MFQLTDIELESLTSQIGSSLKGIGGRRYNPYVFTEHGIVMLSNVINSKKAIDVSIQVIRVFNKLKQIALTHQELTKRLDEMEVKYDDQFKVVFKVLKELITTQKKSNIR